MVKLWENTGVETKISYHFQDLLASSVSSMPAMNATAAASVSINMLSCDSIDGVTVKVSVNILYSVVVTIKVLYSVATLYSVIVVEGALTASARSTYLPVSIDYVLSNSKT
jgi:hypothetical protein